MRSQNGPLNYGCTCNHLGHHVTLEGGKAQAGWCSYQGPDSKAQVAGLGQRQVLSAGGHSPSSCQAQ